MKKLVLVTGSGRSGTSSVAGTLSRLGFHIPEPQVKADEKNPLGYYEPAWVIRYHAKWLESIPVRTIDSRPDARRIAMETLNDARRDRLQRWVGEQVDERPDGDTLIVKDPRACWVLPLWYDVVAQAGAEMATLTMLRHPTQVVRSRETAYQSGRSEEWRLQRETTNVAAWINSIFATEGSTRGHQRTFVRYVDLLADWRQAMTRACDQLGLDAGDLSAPHAVDDFITSKLNRSADTWEGLAVAQDLRDLADATWSAVSALVDDPADDAAQTALDRLEEEYRELYASSSAICADETDATVWQLRRKNKVKFDRLSGRIEELEKQLAERDAELEAARKGRGKSGWLR